MVDISNLGAIDEDVPFNHAVADALIAAFNGAASTIDGQAGSRAGYVSTASADFRGHFCDLFHINAQVAAADARELSNRLREVARGAQRLQQEAQKEQQRRLTARKWKHEQDHKSTLDKIGDWFTGGDDPPVGPPAAPPTIQTSPPVNGTRQTPAPGSAGSSGGTSSTTSARASELRKFSTGSAGLNADLAHLPGRLKGHLTDFAAQCRWGQLEASGVITGFQKWLAANDQDVRWMNTVADAFAAAGGEGTMVWLLNSTIATVLQWNGISETRKDLTIAPPQAYGHPPTTGYADDPVNTATGNFVETESDLEFTGGTGDLQFARTYNSVDQSSGHRPFGPGWSSILDLRLELTDDGAMMVQADGRGILFPRSGAGWERATGENLWLRRASSPWGDVLLVSDNDGRSWTFTPTGDWIATSRGAGNSITACRDSEGRLIGLEAERGRSITIEWSADRVGRISSSDDREVRFDYDQNGQLITATSQLGSRRYRWNDAGLIETVIGADGVVEVQNSYDDHGRVIGQRSPYGRESRYSYLAGRITVVSDPNGNRSNTWVADERGRLVAVMDAAEQRQSMSYDRYGNLLSVTERDGSVTVHSYDERGRRVRTVTPTGADLTYGYDDLDRVITVVAESGAVTELGYTDADRNPSLIVDPEGGRTELTWQVGLLRRIVDPVGVPVRFDYDEHGDLTAVTDADNNTARLERDTVGRVTAAITPSGARTSYHYGPDGLLASRRDPDGAVWRYEHTAGRLTAVIDPLGGRTDLEYGSHGELTRTIDPLGRAVTCSVDDLGNLSAVELPDASSWRFTHDASSRLTRTVDPAGNAWRHDHDVNGNPVAFTDPTGVRRGVTADRSANSAELTLADTVTAVRFDRLGRPVAADGPDGSAQLISYGLCGRPVELVDGEGGLTVLRRDAAGRLVERVSPSGATTTYTYDACGRLASVVDPTGGRTTYGYDRDGREIRRELPTGEAAWTTYDPMGRVLARFEPGYGLARFGYDRLGRVTSVSDSWYGSRRFRYDAAGQLVEMINGNGGATRYDYDACGRVTTITDPLGGVSRRTYDPLNRLISSTDPLGRTTTAEYDAAGRPISQTDPVGHQLGWSYDAAGRESSYSVDGRAVSTIHRDLPNRTVVVTDDTDPGCRVHHELHWNRRNQLLSRRRNGRGPAWSYDADGNRTELIGPDGVRTRYTTDAAGRVVAVEHPALGRATFDYDAAGRLIRAGAGDLIQTWTYSQGFVTEHEVTSRDGSLRTGIDRDEWGRITRIGDDRQFRRYAYDRACQLIEERGTDGSAANWRYDQAGRLTSETVDGIDRNHHYDAAGQLVDTIVGAGPDAVRIDHWYDAAGRRIGTENPDGSRSCYGWSPNGLLKSITETDAAGAGRTHRLWTDVLGELGRIDQTETWWDSATEYAAGPLQIGDLAVLATPGGLTGIGRGWQLPGWRTGRAMAAADPWLVTPTIHGPGGIGIGAAGELTVAGLEWMGARAYDPMTRGFLSVDPLDPVPGAGWAGNPYAFAGNDPLHALDPTGLRPVTDAELKVYAASNDGAFAAAGHWLANNWEYVAGGALVVAGGALMVTGVGGPAGMALLSAGADTIIQKATTGKVNWGEVAISGVIGGVGGAAAAWAGRAASVGAKAWAARAAVYGGIGSMGSEASYVSTNSGHLSVRGAIGAGAGGFVSGLFSAASTPVGGSIANAVGKGGSKLASKGFTAGVSFIGGSSGSITNNLVSGDPINLTGAGISGTTSAVLSPITKIAKPHPDQPMSKVGDIAVHGPGFHNLLDFAHHNSRALWGAAAQGAIQSYVAKLGLHEMGWV